MRPLNNLVYVIGLYRGNELSAEGIGTTNRVETPMPSKTPVNIEAQPEQNPKLSKEREQELESWMEEVKAFIRKIDVNNL